MRGSQLRQSNALLIRSLVVIAGLTIGFASLCIGAYWWWFTQHLSAAIASDTAAWGQFGDYVGGVAGTLLVGATLVALVVSIRIQQKLYEAAKAEFETTAGLLSQQTENARLQSVLNGFRFAQQLLRDHMQIAGHEHSLRDVWRVFSVHGQLTWTTASQVVSQDFRNREGFLGPFIKLTSVLCDIADGEQPVQRDAMQRMLAACLNDDAMRALRILAYFDVPDNRLGRSLNGNRLFALTEVQEQLLAQQLDRTPRDAT